LLIDHFKNNLASMLRSADDLEAQLQDGKAFKTDMYIGMYRSFLGSAIQSIAAIKFKITSTIEEADEWLTVAE
jgi:hypothetical protein